MADFTKQELEAFLQSTEEHLAETKLMGPGYYKVRERYEYAIDADERYIEKLKKQIAEYDQNSLNSNQQIVLDVLKKNANQGLDELIVGGITYMNDEEIDAVELSQQEELYQVLAAFAEWGLKQ